MFVRNNRIRTFLSIAQTHTHKKDVYENQFVESKKKKGLMTAHPVERKTKGIKNCLGLFLFIKLKNKK